jgi:hypothetical protein
MKQNSQLLWNTMDLKMDVKMVGTCHIICQIFGSVCALEGSGHLWPCDDSRTFAAPPVSLQVGANNMANTVYVFNDIHNMTKHDKTLYIL